MNFIYFKSFIYICLIISFSFLNGLDQQIKNNCSICLGMLDDKFLIDKWGNKFHSKHLQDGIFCNSCSRIISQNITKGGFRLNDGRYLCKLCKISSIEDDSLIKISYNFVLDQLKQVGFDNFSNNIPIKLINLDEINHIKGGTPHVNTKGITKEYHKNNIKYYKIFILYGLPKIEFEAVLAHELLHIWIYNNNISLNKNFVEAFCNLGSAIIYENDNSFFSKLHLQTMENESNPEYGNNYRILKNELHKKGWYKFLKSLKHNK